MIFACDLDQTLIYSRNSMGLIDPDQLEPVETYNGDYLSYMTTAAHQKLQLISKHIHFVPATTRVASQFDRIFGLSQGISSRYAILSNGGKVLIDGQVDRDWESQLRQATLKDCTSVLEIKAEFDRLAAGDSWVLKETYCDELFYSIVVERDRLPVGLMLELSNRLSGAGWNCSLQGRKVYLVPNTVSKGAAVAYVRQLSGATEVFAAGDSLLDESMLVIADEAIAPRHGELFQKYGDDKSNPPFRFTERSGIGASEEILDQVMNRMEVSCAR